MQVLDAFVSTIRQYKVLAVDASCFIYAFEPHPQFAQIASSIFNEASDGSFELVVSTTAVSEVFVGPLRKNDYETIYKYEEVFAGLPYREIPMDYSIAKLAAFLRARHDIFLSDAVHIASAIYAGADAFITNDKQLKRVEQIPVLCLSDYV